MGGGFTYLGATVTDAVIDIDIVSISDNEVTGNILESSFVNGSNVIPGGYPGVSMVYQSHSFGWFDTRRGYYVAQSLCTVAGQCLTDAFVQENQNKLMVYARSPTLGLTVWLVSGSGAAPRAAAEALVEITTDADSTGNRGTGLSPGAWSVGGGLTYLGATLADAVIDIDIVSISDTEITANILDSSVVNGSNVIAGGYPGVSMVYKSHSFGWFDTRRGYYVAQSLCTVSGQCLTDAFVQENQNKLMVYARSPTLGLTVWLVSGNGAVPRTAAMVEVASRSTGNRGTGLSPGGWKVDGGLSYLGATLTDASMDIDVVAIDDNTVVFNVLESSIVNGSNVVAGGYQGVTASYKRHNFGLFDNRNGYYVAQSICLVNGQCLTEAFIEEGQSKLMVYARSP